VSRTQLVSGSGYLHSVIKSG